MEKQFKRFDKNDCNLPIRLLVLFLFYTLVFALIIVVLPMISIAYVQRYSTPIVALICTMATVALILALIAIFQGKITLYKTIFSGYLLALFFLIVLLIAELTDFITIIQSPELYEKFLQRTGAFMPIIYIVLQIVQVLFLPIPGIFSILGGIRLFGAFFAALYSYIGAVIGSYIAFLIGRKWGNKGVAWLVGEDRLAQWRKRMKGKDNLIITSMFLLPLFPDDILCFLSGVSTMSAKYFFIMILLTRAVSIFATAYSISFIPFNTWWGLLIWGILLSAFVMLVIIIYKNIDKINQFLRKKRKQ